MLSITGEKIGESHVVEAFARVATRFPVAGFCVSAELVQPPRYVFGVEPAAKIVDAELLDACEAALREVNIEYAAKRDSLRLGPPKLKLLEQGAFERFRRERVASGAPDSHVKPPHLVREIDKLDALGVDHEFQA